MSNSQIRFQYCQEDIIIQCLKSELMKEIIGRYGKESGLPIDRLSFLCNGNQVNQNLTLEQINDKDTEVLILVNSKEKKEKENQIIISDYIKCEQSLDPAIVEFSNDYKIVLSNGNHNIQKIKLQDYNGTQIVDQSKIKCCKCSKVKEETYQNNFYYCFECDKNFCPTCQPSHIEHKNIIDYSFKYFRCSIHKNKELNSYCFDCKKNLCVFCEDQHKEHNVINFNNLLKEQSKETIEKIQKVKIFVDNIIDSLQKFKGNLDVYLQINKKLNDNLKNMNLNYENLKNTKNLMEMSFLKKDFDEILNSNDINKKFQKIMSIYDIMNERTNNTTNDDSENSNEIELKIKIEQRDINKNVYFLDNTQESDYESGYNENGKYVKHNHDNLSEINENNTTLIIDGKTVPFQKYFIPKTIRTYSIKLLFKNELSNCAYMFCQCNKIIDINFSKFKTKNIKNMSHMFCGCSSLSNLDLKSFKTEKITEMYSMFLECSSLKSLDLSSFNTQNVNSFFCMFRECSSLTSLNLSSFNTINITNMESMFNKCSSLTSLDLSSFNTINVINFGGMFKECSSLKNLNLSSFNTQNVISMGSMFCNCSSLTSINLSSFNTKKVTSMSGLFKGCSSLTEVDLYSFNAVKANTNDMFGGCKNLKSCGCCSDKNIINAFNKK